MKDERQNQRSCKNFPPHMQWQHHADSYNPAVSYPIEPRLPIPKITRILALRDITGSSSQTRCHLLKLMRLCKLAAWNLNGCN
jgi:hypothetical protein